LKLAVIGAGVICITTAYELTRDGHEVTVFERHDTAAEEASFANGGLISPGWLAQLAAPGGASSLFRHPAGLKVAGLPNASQWRWLWRWLQVAQSPQHAANRLHMHRPQYSRRLAAITNEHQLEYDRSEGLLVLWRTEREATQAHAALQPLRDQGAVLRDLDAAQVRQIEPSLNPDTPLHGALELPTGTAANCRQFTLLLNQAQQLGCRFEFGTTVERMDTTHGVKLTVAGAQAPVQAFDGVVLCAGVASAALLRPLGLHLPLQPVFGHSISAAVREPLDAPLSAVMDGRNQVSISRLGQRVRVAGGAALGGEPGVKSAAELRRLYRVLMDWFPGAARLGGPKGSVQEWRGAQAMLPDGSPLVGSSCVPRVWLNLGHGGSGWAMACGSARALADQILGRAPEIDITPYSPTRLKR
jgi:D-amino-acid dehydrogenase